MGKEDTKKRFLEYAEQHPEYYPIMQTGVFIKVVEVLAKEAKSKDDFSAALPRIDKEDIEAMLELLIKVELVAKLVSLDQVLYYATDKGKEFLEYCELAKDRFTVA